MSHLPGVLFFWKDPERPIDMILLQSEQSKGFVVIDTSVFFPSDVFSLQWLSGLVQTILPKIFPTIKQDHQHDEYSSAKHAINQEPLSLGAIIDMVISTLDKYYLGLQIN
ncbi:hypothetical protein PHYBLDRAFT_151922 [Phycomyces blakesleeanus NRRL 1555(-)]|uniref:Uncharacterized protein n=1 Tax=Phycomyces blakesleeanus (strain ATCC 8743b / DSM 1359 / FGSC 10004 / NBRC 33097 / NRRL 1555) TaxID=763407 RepID=A0A162N935_PHYB8|nr:hypothetical protein PHYBLDRAFT_151922 [Phycomyces blakesleeanus NRRL 1555(-)]OAD66984.1 hypothetical protein PHYBLDRAFT_151922 [Phycomyces blakesleeanus NRRL 1555(-)]|eukprot:XP_018285024.1 hypothetical protein PHYBLDRAFT_151922 [Phycomyces blakesleeanus NRRL 1555(-)]